MKKIALLGLGLLLALTPFVRASPPAPATQLGVAHIGGLYSFSEQDILNEGGATAFSLGARCLKVSLSLDTENPSPKLYPQHSQWPAVTTLEELADTPYYRALFARGFSTFILTTFRPQREAGYWRKAFTPEDEAAEEACYAGLTRYLLKTYGAGARPLSCKTGRGTGRCGAALIRRPPLFRRPPPA